MQEHHSNWCPCATVLIVFIFIYPVSPKASEMASFHCGLGFRRIRQACGPNPWHEMMMWLHEGQLNLHTPPTAHCGSVDSEQELSRGHYVCLQKNYIWSTKIHMWPTQIHKYLLNFALCSDVNMHLLCTDTGCTCVSPFDWLLYNKSSTSKESFIFAREFNLLPPPLEAN